MLPGLAAQRICGTKFFEITLQALGIRVVLKCGTGEKGVQTPDVILLSLPRETVVLVQKSLEVSQKRLPRETESTCKKSFRMWKTDSDTTKVSQKYRWIPRRCTSRYGRYLWLHRWHGSKYCEEFGNIQEFWIWKHWKSIQCYKHDGCRKFSNEEDISKRFREPIVGEIHTAYWKSNRVDENKSMRVLGFRVMLLNMQSKGWDDQVSTFKDVSPFQRTVRVGWRADWLRVEKFPRVHSTGKRLGRIT